jgi:diguanylate cyclase (GGDEF)-like protein
VVQRAPTHEDVGYGFTDPLRAARARDADQTGREAARSMRAVLRALYAFSALTLLGVLGTPDPDSSDHASLFICAVAAAGIAMVMHFWREPPDAVLLWACPAATLLISALVATAKPLAATPFFYLWPVIVAAYYLRPRELGVNLGLFVVSYGAALALFAEPGIRITLFVGMVVPLVVVGALIVVMKLRLETLVGELRLMATRDPLTHALNRRAFEETLHSEVARTRRTDRACSVALFDVDHFKAINDEHGHAAGDRALTRLARVVERTTRATDRFGRVGGEEFAVLLVDTDLEGAEAYAEQLRAAIAADGGDPVPLTVSVGVAAAGMGDDGEGLLVHADRALYAAKRAGRNRVVLAGR